MRNSFFICCSLLLCTLFYTPMLAQSLQGAIQITADPAIDQLVQLHMQMIQQDNTKTGYRIQIVQASSRDDIRKEKARLLRQYPDLRTYEIYEAPYFKLRAGNFENRFDAYSLFHRLKNNFQSSFIVPDQISLSDM